MRAAPREFDALCAALDIEHRLTRPTSPQTHGMVERFNGQISHVVNTTHSNQARIWSSP
jgi:hypothetical protein